MTGAEFVQGLFTQIPWALLPWAIVGAVVGALVGVLVHLGVILLGVYAWPRARVFMLAFAALWTVGGSALTGAGVGVGFGWLSFWKRFLVEDAFVDEAFQTLGDRASDVVLREVQVAVEEGVALSGPLPEGAASVFRQGTWGLPVEDVRRAAVGLGEGLRAPEAQAVSERVGRAALGGESGERDPYDAFLGAVVVGITATVMEGKDPLALDASMRQAWEGMADASAAQGAPGVLSHGELSAHLTSSLFRPMVAEVTRKAGLVWLLLLTPMPLFAWCIPPLLGLVFRPRPFVQPSVEDGVDVV